MVESILFEQIGIHDRGMDDPRVLDCVNRGEGHFRTIDRMSASISSRDDREQIVLS
jgi:hypothetical protein